MFDKRFWTAAIVVAAVGLATGCGKDTEKKPARGAPSAAPTSDPAQVEAELLGRDLYDIMDRVMAYATSHRRLPDTIAQVGIDSLTPLFVRQVGSQGTSPVVTIVFRKQTGRILASCRGTNAVLEEATINGEFTVGCELLSGGNRTFTITRTPPPPAQDE